MVFVLVGIGVFVLGWFLSSQKKKAEQIAGQLAVQQGLDYVQSQANVTKDWFNQITNTWSQIWK